MATSLAVDQPSVASQSAIVTEDPFSSPAFTSSTHHRFSHFDNQLFTLGPTTSPDQAKRALEAHLAETERRIQDASKLGTMLVQQRKDLAERMKEVEKQQNEGDITPELRKKLIEIEREYNEVGRESARAFLPKTRVSSNEIGGSPFGESKRSISPSKFESQAIGSPSKLNVPNRRQRNQPSSRVHDIEFATEISTSLLSQVRHLQAVLAEKEDALKTTTLERSRLELEVEGFAERLRSLNESGDRYKDENWSLETQIHEYIAKEKEATDRERRLTQSLNILQAEKSAAQKELDEIKSSHAKLSENHAAALKHYEIELGSLKRNITIIETERSVLQRKNEDLTGQNQELARAITHQRLKIDDRDLINGFTGESLETPQDDVTPEHSPPPSPVKGTPRHNMLESETLKSSLHHAHRMIQNLKSNIHREKTEKLEFKRMLQDARDELEFRRGDIGAGSGRKTRKGELKEPKKLPKPSQLGGVRTSKSECYVEDPYWEQDDGQRSPNHAAAKPNRTISGGELATCFSNSLKYDSSDHFETANEQETSDAFETANERATETEASQSVTEDMSDELTETESGPTGPARSSTIPPALCLPGNRRSFQSTASTSDDEYAYDDVKTPTNTTQPPRLRLRVGRGGNRRSRVASEELQFQSSPASIARSSTNGTPHTTGQSLFAELRDMGSDEESILGSPYRSRHASDCATPSRPDLAKYTLPPPVPKLPMIDFGTMTELWEPEPHSPRIGIAKGVESSYSVSAEVEEVHVLKDEHAVAFSQINPEKNIMDASSQFQEQTRSKTDIETDSWSLSTSFRSDISSEYHPKVIEENLAKFPSPPVSPAHTQLANIGSNLETTGLKLTMSTIISETLDPLDMEPVAQAFLVHLTDIAPQALVFSSIQSVSTEPVELRIPGRDAGNLLQDLALEAAVPQKNEPITPKVFLGSFSGLNNNRGLPTTVVSKDKTCGHLKNYPMNETSDPPQPLKELSTNPPERSPKRVRSKTIDESSQTALTSVQIDDILKKNCEDSHKFSSSRRATLSVGVEAQRLQESTGSASKARFTTNHPGNLHDIISTNAKSPGRPGSHKNSISSVHISLPVDHNQVITVSQLAGSPSGGRGSMGPPVLPVSASRPNPSLRPRTPSIQASISPSLRGETTPRPLHSLGTADIHSPTRNIRSRVSSVSSFASELDDRFQMHNELPMPTGIQSGTDPRMINAITQTMIGEYLWKYTRKAGRGAMSENRHRRYFWVHPYTKTLYWSDRDPSSAGRAQLKAKSVPIEAVRVVTDDNPMPPGLHRKSLIIMTPGRAVKFTATTGQRHETWFNSLSYLLLRTAEDTVEDTTEVANGSITREDIAEFNPSYCNSVRPGLTSLSSYNSHTTRNDSPAKLTNVMNGSRSSRPSVGTFSRLSSYWKPGKGGFIGSFSSRHSKHGIENSGSIYEASEVHDSAEDLRELIEKQNRESDKLENVRACCDGRHDVGHLHSSTKSRHSRTIGIASGSSYRSHPQSKRRNSMLRRTD